MPFIFRAACLLPAGLVLVSPPPASADAGRDPQARAPRQAVEETPPKDCTRYNGHYGFYGNPWCTPEEQARWDRWEARRFTGR